MSYDFLTDPDITVNKSGFINQWLSGAQDPGIVAAFSGKSLYIYLLHSVSFEYCNGTRNIYTPRLRC